MQRIALLDCLGLGPGLMIFRQWGPFEDGLFVSLMSFSYRKEYELACVYAFSRFVSDVLDVGGVGVQRSGRMGSADAPSSQLADWDVSVGTRSGGQGGIRDASERERRRFVRGMWTCGLVCLCRT